MVVEIGALGLRLVVAEAIAARAMPQLQDERLAHGGATPHVGLPV